MIFTGLIVGALLGVVLQRGRFCVTGMLRDIFLLRSWRTFTALMIVIAVHAVGIAVLTGVGVISPEYPTFAPAAVVVGGLLFGMGIILAGGCASGTWYRAAEGLVGSWLALAMYALSSAAMKKGALGDLNTSLKSWDTGLTTIPAALGISPWPFVIILVAVTVLMVRHFLKRERQSVRPASLGGRARWKRPLHFYVAAVLVGILGVVAWPLSAAAGRNDGLGITSPSSNVVKFIATGDGSSIDWGVMLVLGLFGGALVAAKATGEFRVRVPDAVTATRSVVGGVMMGVGASWAGGCTVGNGMVQTSLFSFQGWVALVFIALGVGLGAKLWLKPSTAGSKASQPATADAYSTDQSLGGAAGSDDIENQPTSGGTAPFAGFATAPGALAVKAPQVSTKARDLGGGYFALDSLGAVCPFPLIEAKDVMATLSSGDHLVIDFDCTQATEAIPHWAAEDGHEVTDFQERGEASWQITLRKG
ncbi:hypothetical protein D8M21_09900 [Kocuria sp. HSID16901]|nr:hypothetical protein D8M21_09900 [Kocuria sp. HSID16901]